MSINAQGWRVLALTFLTIDMLSVVAGFVNRHGALAWLSVLILAPLLAWAWSIKATETPDRTTLVEATSEGLGQLAHDVYVAAHNGHGGEWNELPLSDQLAWCRTACAVANHIREVDRALSKES